MNKISIIDHVGQKAGMDYYSSSLAKGFISKNADCTIYSNYIGTDADKITYKNYYEGHTKNNSLLKLVKFLLATIKSSYSSKKNQADLVILHLFSADILTLLLILIPKLFGLKIAVISHDVSSFAENDNEFVQNLIYNNLSNYIIVHNQFSYSELMKNIKLKNPQKVNVIKQGGYIEYMKNTQDKVEARQEIGLDINKKYILFFGQIKKVKGLDILLEAMSKTSGDISLIIAGKPWKDDFSKYDDLIDKYKLQERIVKIIRFIEDDEREKLFFAADVNVLPYRTIYQSAVLLMAMSYGLPVIVSDLQANKETINDLDNGLLFISEDPQSLKEKIEMFFNDESLQNKLASNAVKTIKEEFDWNDIASKYLELIGR